MAICRSQCTWGCLCVLSGGGGVTEHAASDPNHQLLVLGHFRGREEVHWCPLGASHRHWLQPLLTSSTGNMFRCFRSCARLWWRYRPTDHWGYTPYRTILVMAGASYSPKHPTSAPSSPRPALVAGYWRGVAICRPQCTCAVCVPE